MSKTVEHQGINVIGLLGVVFIVLKLTGYIDWKWAWELNPWVWVYEFERVDK